MARLSPAGRRARRAELAVLGVAGAYRVGVQFRVRPPYQVPANLAMGACVLGIARAGGAGAADLGLDPGKLRRGLAFGVLAAVGVSAGTALLVSHPTTRHLFADPLARDASVRHVVYESVVRIPLGTAVFEEALFRGALYGLDRLWLPAPLRIPWNCLLFGLWHLPEGVRQVLEPERHAQLSLGTGGALVGSVLATGFGGVWFWLERAIGASLLTSTLGHAGSNVSAYLGALATVHVYGERPPTPERDAMAVAEEDAVLPERYELPPLVPHEAVVIAYGPGQHAGQTRAEIV